MNKKLTVSFGLCLLFSMALISAATVENTKFVYDKKSDLLKVTFDEILDNECPSSMYIEIFNKKNDLIGYHEDPKNAICQIIWNGKVIMDFSTTGIFQRSYDIELDKKIKGKNINFEISNMYNGDIFDSGSYRIKPGFRR